MTTYAQTINNHYGQADLGVTILTALQRAGKNVNALTRDDIISYVIARHPERRVKPEVEGRRSNLK